MITIKKFAALTGISVSTVRNMVKDGRLSFTKLPGSRGLILVDYEKFITDNRNEELKESCPTHDMEDPKQNYHFIRNNLYHIVHSQMVKTPEDFMGITKNLATLHQIEKFLLDIGYYTPKEE